MDNKQIFHFYEEKKNNNEQENNQKCIIQEIDDENNLVLEVFGTVSNKDTNDKTITNEYTCNDDEIRELNDLFNELIKRR